MDGSRKIISENQLPLSAPPVDQAWMEMRRLLDEHKPEITPILPLKKPGFPGAVKYISGVVLVLLMISTVFYFTNHSRNKMESNTPLKPSSAVSANENHPQSNATANLPQLNSSVNNTEINVNKTGEKTYGVDGQIPEDKYDKQLMPVTNTGSSKKNNLSDQYDNDLNNILRNEAPALQDINLATTEKVPANVPITDTSFEHANDNLLGKNRDSIIDTSAAEAGIPHIELPEEEWSVNAGLNWNLPLPLYNASNYFIGPNGLSQPYRLLLPGAWIQAEKEKHLMTLELHPFASSLPPSTVFRTVTTFQNNQDTLVQTKDERSLVKTFGLSAGVGYQYKIKSNWWIGAGVQMHYWFRAVAASNAEIQKIPMGGTIGTTTNQSQIYTLTDEWSYFSRMQVSLIPEIIYKTPKWQTGFRLGVPITPLALKDGPKHFLRAEFIYRLKLLDIHLKK